MDLFEMATRNKFRFPYKGMISVEHLWDLGQVQLDTVYKALNREIKKTDEASLVSTDNLEDAELTAKIKIVEFIFDIKANEAAARKIAAENAEKKRRIAEILAQKQEESLMSKSEDELKKMLDAFDL